MAIIPTDLLIKTMLEAAVADLKKNLWLLDDVFAGLASDPLSSLEYGYKEVTKAIEWFKDNNFPVYLHNRIDNPTFPCITVVQASSSEMQDRASLGDEGGIEDFDPKDARRTPQYI